MGGRVLEVGPGNGPNFPLYPPSVREVAAVEPEPYLRERASEAAAEAPVAVRVVAGVADTLPVAPGWADAVVCCLVLCSVPEQATALREIRGALREDGELLLFEHVGADNRAARAVLRAAEVTLWRRAFGNCHPTRQTLAAVEGAGFDVSVVRRRVFRASALEPPLPYIVGVRDDLRRRRDDPRGAVNVHRTSPPRRRMSSARALRDALRAPVTAGRVRSALVDQALRGRPQ